eukprot:759773-Hanusia_phi.AAC.2
MEQEDLMTSKYGADGKSFKEVELQWAERAAEKQRRCVGLLPAVRGSGSMWHRGAFLEDLLQLLSSAPDRMAVDGRFQGHQVIEPRIEFEVAPCATRSPSCDGCFFPVSLHLQRPAVANVHASWLLLRPGDALQQCRSVLHQLPDPSEFLSC